MAAEILRHQSSMAYYDNNHSGCMWSLLRFLDFHKQHHKRKMLSYRSHGDEKHGRRTRILTSAQNVTSSEQEQLLDKGVNFQMEDKHRVKKKSSGKAHFLTLLYKKMTKKKDKKLKTSSSASRLLHTLSIHHLECDSYVLSDSATSDGDSSTFEDSSARSEKAALLPRGPEGALDKMRLKDVIEENRRTEHRISMDGVLDKIPIDRRFSDNVEEGKRSDFGSEGFVYTNSKFAQRSIQRSRSLTEASTVREPQTLSRRSNSLSDSLGRYSHLLESISAREPQRSRSIKEQDNSFARRTPPSHSLTESFDVYSRLLESVSVREAQNLPRRSNSVREKDSSLGCQKTLRSRSLTDSSDVYSRMLESVSVREPKRQPERLLSILEEDSFLSNGRLVNTEEITRTETFEHHNEESTSTEMMAALDQPELIVARDPTEEFIILDELTVNDSSSDCGDHKGEHIVKEDPSDKPTEPRPVPVIDLHFEEDPASAAKYAMKQGKELQPSCLTLEEENDGANLENPMVEFIYTTDTGNINTSQVKEAALYNYVKGILKKSGFDEGAEEFLAAWYSSYEPIDQLLFVSELETMRDDCSEIPLDCRLILDLINEVLLDIYEITIARSTGLSRFCPQIRTMPVGDDVLQEVWEKVKWHLNPQRHMNNSFEQLGCPDFAKSDGWMNLFLDVEGVGIELEGLILDDLIDEIIVDFQDM